MTMPAGVPGAAPPSAPPGVTQVPVNPDTGYVGAGDAPLAGLGLPTPPAAPPQVPQSQPYVAQQAPPAPPAQQLPPAAPAAPPPAAPPSQVPQEPPLATPPVPPAPAPPAQVPQAPQAPQAPQIPQAPQPGQPPAPPTPEQQQQIPGPAQAQPSESYQQLEQRLRLEANREALQIDRQYDADVAAYTQAGHPEESARALATQLREHRSELALNKYQGQLNEAQRNDRYDVARNMAQQFGTSIEHLMQYRTVEQMEVAAPLLQMIHGLQQQMANYAAPQQRFEGAQAGGGAPSTNDMVDAYGYGMVSEQQALADPQVRAMMDEAFPGMVPAGQAAGVMPPR